MSIIANHPSAPAKNCKIVQLLWNEVIYFWGQKKIQPYYLLVYTKKIESRYSKATLMFIAALVTVAKTCNQRVKFFFLNVVYIKWNIIQHLKDRNF